MTDIVTLGDIVDRDAITTAQSQVNAMVTEEQWTALLAENNALKDMTSRLDQELGEARSNAQRYANIGANLRNDIAHIADRILEGANGRGWCSEYDSIVEELNSRMSEEHLLKRVTDYTFRADFTISVTASDDSQASDIADQLCRIMQRVQSGVNASISYDDLNDISD